MPQKKAIAVTGKISIEEFEELNQRIEADPLLNKSAIISKAIEQYLHGAKPSNPAELTTLKTEVEALKRENEKLKTEAEKQKVLLRESLEKPDANLKEAKMRIVNLQELSEKLQTENEKLKNQPPKTVKLAENQLLITVPPTLQPFLIEVANRESNRVGKKITPDMIMLNLFWAQVSKGPGDHLPITFSPSEIRRRLDIVKQQQSA